MVDLVRVRVLEGKKLYWRGRDRTGGEIVEVPEKEARLIVAVKKGELAPVERRRVPDPQALKTTSVPHDPDMPESVTGSPLREDEDSGAEGRQGRRRYQRRDMRAKE